MNPNPGQNQPNPEDPLDVKSEPPVPSPKPPPLDYGRRGTYGTPPLPRTTPLSFSLRALGGFGLFFATIYLAAMIGLWLKSGIGFFCVLATAFAALIVLSFVFHRRGWLTGWLTGFFLAASLIGLLIYTCRNTHW